MSRLFLLLLILFGPPPLAWASEPAPSEASLEELAERRLDRRAALERARSERDVKLRRIARWRAATQRLARTALPPRGATPAFTLTLPRPAVPAISGSPLARSVDRHSVVILRAPAHDRVIARAGPSRCRGPASQPQPGTAY